MLSKFFKKGKARNIACVEMGHSNIRLAIVNPGQDKYEVVYTNERPSDPDMQIGYFSPYHAKRMGDLIRRMIPDDIKVSSIMFAFENGNIKIEEKAFPKTPNNIYDDEVNRLEKYIYQDTKQRFDVSYLEDHVFVSSDTATLGMTMIPRKLIEDCKDVAACMGLFFEGIADPGYAAIKAYFPDELRESDVTSMVVHIGERSTSMYCTIGDVVRFKETTMVGLNPILDIMQHSFGGRDHHGVIDTVNRKGILKDKRTLNKESYSEVNALLQKCKMYMDKFEKQIGRPVDKIYITGKGACLFHMSDILQETTGKKVENLPLRAIRTQTKFVYGSGVANDLLYYTAAALAQPEINLLWRDEDDYKDNPRSATEFELIIQNVKSGVNTYLKKAGIESKEFTTFIGAAVKKDLSPTPMFGLTDDESKDTTKTDGEELTPMFGLDSTGPVQEDIKHSAKDGFEPQMVLARDEKIVCVRIGTHWIDINLTKDASNVFSDKKVFEILESTQIHTTEPFAFGKLSDTDIEQFAQMVSMQLEAWGIEANRIRFAFENDFIQFTTHRFDKNQIQLEKVIEKEKKDAAKGTIVSYFDEFYPTNNEMQVTLIKTPAQIAIECNQIAKKAGLKFDGVYDIGVSVSEMMRNEFITNNKISILCDIGEKYTNIYTLWFGYVFDRTVIEFGVAELLNEAGFNSEIGTIYERMSGFNDKYPTMLSIRNSAISRDIIEKLDSILRVILRNKSEVEGALADNTYICGWGVGIDAISQYLNDVVVSNIERVDISKSDRYRIICRKGINVNNEMHVAYTLSEHEWNTVKDEMKAITDGTFTIQDTDNDDKPNDNGEGTSNINTNATKENKDVQDSMRNAFNKFFNK